MMKLITQMIVVYIRFRCSDRLVLCAVSISLISVIVSVSTLAGLCLPGNYDALNTRTHIPLREYLNQAMKRQYTELTEKKEREKFEFFQNGRRLQLATYGNNVHFENMKPAAKLIGKDEKNTRHCHEGKMMTPVKDWLEGGKHYDASGFMRFGAKQYKSRIALPLTGTYAIYSYVEYNYTHCMSKHTGTTLFRHEIYRFNVLEEKEQVIVTDEKHSVPTMRGSEEIVGSYIFTTAELRAGDELAVRVNNLKHTSNIFFGLNLI